jgi:hypothetical protein
VEVTVYLFLLAKNVANVAAAVAMNDQDQHARTGLACGKTCLSSCEPIVRD